MTRIALTQYSSNSRRLELLVCCSLLGLTACGQPDIVVSTPPPPQDWLVCEPAPERPSLAPLVPVTMPDGRVAYVKSDTDTRDLAIAGYIIGLRSAWFDCSNQLGKVRDYFEDE